MSVLTPLTPAALAERLKAGAVTLVDIREPDEFTREHIADAVSVPLSRLEDAHLSLEAGGDVVFTCRTGGRTGQHCERLAARVEGPAYVLEGGLEAWKTAGLAVAGAQAAPAAAHTTARPASRHVERQVRFVAGALVLAGVVLSLTVHPAFIALSGFVGAALMFAGATGFCLMERLLAGAPWNRSHTA